MDWFIHEGKQLKKYPARPSNFWSLHALDLPGCEAAGPLWGWAEDADESVQLGQESLGQPGINEPVTRDVAEPEVSPSGQQRRPGVSGQCSR